MAKKSSLKNVKGIQKGKMASSPKSNTTIGFGTSKGKNPNGKHISTASKGRSIADVTGSGAMGSTGGKMVKGSKSGNGVISKVGAR